MLNSIALFQRVGMEQTLEDHQIALSGSSFQQGGCYLVFVNKSNCMQLPLRIVLSGGI